MRLASHLRVSRHGIYCFRLVLPQPIARLVGQTEIKRSLGTRHSTEARLLAYRLCGRILPVIKTLARDMANDPTIDPKNARELLIKGLVIDANGVRADHVEFDPDPAKASQEMAALAAMFNPPQTRSSKEIQAERAAIAAYAAHEHDPVENPQTLGVAFDTYLATQKRSIAPSSKKTYQSAFAVFARLVGGSARMTHTVTAKECARVAEAMTLIPPNATKKGFDLGTAEDILARKIDPDATTLAAGTINDQLNTVSKFFDWAIASHRHTGPNPMQGIPRPTVSHSSRSGADRFSEEDLTLIFDPELMAGINRPHLFWGALFGLFTGARCNEIAQLRLRDFEMEDGIRCIRITADDGVSKGKTSAKLRDASLAGTRTKNQASKRLLPLHPILWEIGLQAYLDDLKLIGADRLFPNLPLANNSKREKYLSRDFNTKHLVQAGVHQPRTKVFHSFRDTCASALARGGVHNRYIEQWMGHSHDTIEGRHYIADLTAKELSDKVWQHLRFGFINFDAIRYSAGRWNDWMKNNIKL